MRNMTDEQRRYQFRDWVRAELRRLDFWHRRGNRYLISDFVRYAREQGAHVEEAPLARWLRDESPVLPTAESCRELARALGTSSVEVLLAAGHLVWEDIGLIVDEFERGTDGALHHRGRRVPSRPQLPAVDPGVHQRALTGQEDWQEVGVREPERR